VAAVVAPGSAGLVIGAVIAAVAASEYLGRAGGAGDAGDLESVGQPSGAALRMAERLEAEERDAAPGEPFSVDDSPLNSDNSTRD